MSAETSTPEPVLTKRQHTRLDGQGFTTAVDEVYADGRPTGILFTEQTNGRSGGYRYTDRRIVKGEEAYDLMAPGATSEAAMEWIRARIPATTPTTEPAQ